VSPNVTTSASSEKTSSGVGHPRVSLKMETDMNLISRFVRDESGATAIEYGLIASLIAVVIIGAVSAVGTSLTATFTRVSTGLTTP
jgi:pilus assembly protein Flp/PilA